MKKIITVVAVLGVLAIILIVSTKAKHSNSDPIKIGGIFGLTGDSATWGEEAKNGALLAVEEINNSGGIKGRPIQFIVDDMLSTSQGSISAVSKQINIDHVSAIVGPGWLDVYQGAAPLVKEKNIIMVSPDAGIEAVNSPIVHKNVFSTWYRVDVKARIDAEYMAKNGVKKLAIIVQNDPYYTDFISRIKKYAEANGIEVVLTEFINSGSTDVRTPALKISKSGADAVLFAFYDEKITYNFLKTKLEVFPSAKLFGDELVEDHLNDKDFAGLYEGVTYFHAIEPQTDFREKYNEPIFGAANSYDATKIVAKMLTEKGLDAKDYNEYLRSAKFDSKAFGDITFDEIGGVKTNNNQFNLWKIENNQKVKVN